MPRTGQRTSTQHDPTIRAFANEPPAQSQTKLVALTRRKRRDVRARRALSFEERGPIVLERGEARLNRERLFTRLLQSMFPPERDANDTHERVSLAPMVTLR